MHSRKIFEEPVNWPSYADVRHPQHNGKLP